MFLQVMPFPWDIGDRRLPRTQLDPGDFPDGRIGFLGLGGIYFGADGFLLVALFEERSFGEFREGFTGTSGD